MGQQLIVNKDELVADIELLRTDLIIKSNQLGMNHQATIQASQKLDYYIIQYQRMAKKDW
ncbi:aspartyl-phosphate phosphatase Spo0E family protein [Neobacillus sp. YIM B06451]|uniref:aspartyl-phosphate phosphatase Spo0E family protein n=1 Tax=Neobacillus sp. YIM B06451 TaxID=3070994 RepID=UPI00292DFA17|nr:aspartyl-phosphate phosphatase Spo0E family protein [Neobacillus sp. YIM B06451]